MKQTNSGGRSPSTTVISYRLDPEAAKALSAEAQKLGLASAHELARRVLLEWLTDQERHHLRQSLSRLHKDVLKLREDLKQAVIAILCDAGKLEKEDAEDWVNRTLFQK
jgi:hypothetical protein